LGPSNAFSSDAIWSAREARRCLAAGALNGRQLRMNERRRACREIVDDAVGETIEAVASREHGLPHQEQVGVGERFVEGRISVRLE
jgi:hypothetical protein